ncbi:MAG: GNAT family N-acetyltransferase [Frankiaceae bacterium]
MPADPVPSPAPAPFPLIRTEEPPDETAVRRLVTEAFGDDHAARLVDLLRRSPGHLPELALVAVDGDGGGGLLGHVMLTVVDLVTEPGEAVPVLCLSPLSVAPPAQRRGIGSALVRNALARADERGWPLVTVEGNPALYQRYGFTVSTALGIERPSELIPQQGFMCLPLRGYDPALRGRIDYPEPFWAVGAVGPSGAGS